MTGVVPSGGLAGIDQAKFLPPAPLPNTAGLTLLTKVWDIDQFEPDKTIGRSYSGGAIASYGDYLFFSTLHIPTISALTWQLAAQPVGVDSTTAYINTWRASSVFRGKNMGAANQTIELLYGNETLPKWTPSTAPVFNPIDNPATPYINETGYPVPGKAGTFVMTPNLLGQAPLYGLPSGIMSPLNVYGWSMEVWKGGLWFTTFDASVLLGIDPGDIVGLPPDLFPPALLSLLQHGADLYHFPTPESQAIPENISGIGNELNYGGRNLLPAGDSLFVGMANPFNLATGPGLKGGWELIELKRPTANTAVGKNVKVNLVGGEEITFCETKTDGVTRGNTNLPYPDLGTLDLSTILPGFELPESPRINGVLPDKVSVFYSTSDWHKAANCLAKAKVCVSDRGLPNPHLYQLQFGLTGANWVDITDDNTNGKICGSVNTLYLGLFTVQSGAERPVANAGPDINVECQVGGTPVTLAGSGTGVDGPLSYKWTDPFKVVGTTDTVNLFLPVGIQPFILTVSDTNGKDKDEAVVTVKDTGAPKATLTLKPDVLWPPDRRLVNITATIKTTDCDAKPKVTLVNITSSEKDSGLEAGDKPNDIQQATKGTDDRTFKLRAERHNPVVPGDPNLIKDGRVYTVVYNVTDASGNSTIISGKVKAPYKK
jgi:hypothetical protein